MKLEKRRQDDKIHHCLRLSLFPKPACGEISKNARISPYQTQFSKLACGEIKRECKNFPVSNSIFQAGMRGNKARMEEIHRMKLNFLSWHAGK
ncbi:MAG: hypothetical protein IKQ96_09450 [Lachnospiraceae bacterium]|nr:hypothetical protein [Lachnospiraceae bacterium]